MMETKPARFGTLANELTQDGESKEYGMIIWLGTKDESEAELLADKISEAWNEMVNPEVKQ